MLTDKLKSSSKNDRIAQQSYNALSSHKEAIFPTLDITTQDGEQELLMPETAYRMLFQILNKIAEGQDLILMADTSEVTTQEAAGILNVSRPFLIGLLEKHQIPFRKVGTRRKILLSALIAYKNKIDNQRTAILDKLADDAQKSDMGDE